jgi:RimJ/RimL family protein N-acetyltransferase
MALLPDLLPAGDVVLRRWVPPLAEALLAAVAASYDELHQWMPWAAEPPTGAGIRAVVVEGSAAFDGDVRWSYVVARPGHDEVLGSAGVHSRGTAGAVEIGYWIRSDATGHGYATKAAGALTSRTRPTGPATPSPPDWASWSTEPSTTPSTPRASPGSFTST